MKSILAQPEQSNKLYALNEIAFISFNSSFDNSALDSLVLFEIYFAS